MKLLNCYIAKLLNCKSNPKQFNNAAIKQFYSAFCILPFVFCILHSSFCIAQTDSLRVSVKEKIDALYKRSNEKVIPLETADEMLKDARALSLNDLDDEQGDMLMKVYQSITDAYAANFRFKPAYLVYNEYINLKNGFIERKKNSRIEKINIETNRLKDENELRISANEGQIAALQAEHDTLVSAKQNVYRSLWIVVIVVAFSSGAIIWFINNRYRKAKHKLNANRERMMSVANTSAIGEFCAGMNRGNGGYLTGLEQVRSDVSKLAASPMSQNKMVATLFSQLRETLAKL